MIPNTLDLRPIVGSSFLQQQKTLPTSLPEYFRAMAKKVV